MVESRRKIPGPSPGIGEVAQETRFYITSLILPTDAVGPMIRDRWAIENCLHWVLDMVFRDDECRVRTENAPANFVTLKHMASNLIRKAPGKDSQRLKRMTAAWDDDFLASLVAA
jgi:predicted transposase YbfD/YdcC